MLSLGSVSKRTKAIYNRYYAEREATRFANLYAVYDTLATYVDASDLGVKLEIDYLGLGEIVRSYFLDVIRYKEYHFDPKFSSEEFSAQVSASSLKSIDDIDPLSPEWASLVHQTANINESKVAAYTVKWILRYKPISALVTKSGIAEMNGTTKPVDSAKPLPFIMNINEYYALHCAFLALGISAQSVSRRKIDELIYCFRFRSFDESSYFMILSKEYLCSDGER